MIRPETAQTLDELRDELAAARQSLDRLERRLEAVEVELHESEPDLQAAGDARSYDTISSGSISAPAFGERDTVSYDGSREPGLEEFSVPTDEPDEFRPEPSQPRPTVSAAASTPAAFAASAALGVPAASAAPNASASVSDDDLMALLGMTLPSSTSSAPSGTAPVAMNVESPGTRTPPPEWGSDEPEPLEFSLMKPADSASRALDDLPRSFDDAPRSNDDTPSSFDDSADPFNEPPGSGDLTATADPASVPSDDDLVELLAKVGTAGSAPSDPSPPAPRAGKKAGEVRDEGRSPRDESRIDFSMDELENILGPGRG